MRLALALQDNHGNQALRPRLVIRKRRPDLRHLLVEAVSFGPAVDYPRSGLELLGPAGFRHLHLDLRVGPDIPEPHRILWRPALGSHDDVVVAFSAVNQGGGDGVAALRSARSHQQDVLAKRAAPEPMLASELIYHPLIEGTPFHLSISTPCTH